MNDICSFSQWAACRKFRTKFASRVGRVGKESLVYDVGTEEGSSYRAQNSWHTTLYEIHSKQWCQESTRREWYKVP